MIELRRAREEDGTILLLWRNHPSVRERFFDEREIPHEEHEGWFRESLQNENRIILIGCEKGAPVGVVRFDIVSPKGEAAEIDIYVDPERHGEGIGKRILRDGERWMREHTKVRRLTARVKRNNTASRNMFEAAGFVVDFINYSKSIEIGEER